MTAAAPHLRAILIAGALAATAVALGFYTMVRQHVAPVTPPVVAPHHPAKPQAAPKLQADVAAALGAGLPKRVAAQFARHEVVVVTLYSRPVAVDRVVAGEARAGAALGDAGFVAVDVGKGPAADKLSSVFGVLSAPATLVLARGGYGAPVTRLDGFADRQTVAQAALNADPTPGNAERSPWARRAQALCTRSSNRFAALGPIATRTQLRHALPRARTIGGALVTGLAATKGPAGAKSLVAFLRADLAQTLRLASATVAHDTVAAADATAKQASAAAHVRTLSASLGVPSCAQPF